MYLVLLWDTLFSPLRSSSCYVRHADHQRVKCLSIVLRDLEDVLPERELTLWQQQDRQDHIRGCENVLKDLDQIIEKYQRLLAGFGNKSRNLWKRLKVEPEDVRELMFRLISNIG